MPIDASIYQNLRPVDMPSIADSAQKAMSLSQMALQQKKLGQDLDAEKIQAHLQKASAFGNALEGLAGLSEQERAAAYPRLHAEMSQAGIISPDQIPAEYDPGFYRASLMRYRASKQGIEDQLAKAHTAYYLGEAEKNKAEASGKGLKNLTPGEKQADETFGKDAADYYYGGGKSSVEKNMGRLQSAIKELEANPDLTGGLTTRLPLLSSDAAQDTLNPKLAAVRDDIRGAIQGTLRQVLGPQFTEREGTAIFNRAFNPALSAKENVRRATAELEALKNMAAAKDKSMGQFLAKGTLKGYKPSGTQLDQGTAYAEQGQGGSGLIPDANAADLPKLGAMDGGYVYMGGDPSNPKSWKKAR